MKKIIQFLASVSVVIILLAGSVFSSTAQAQIIKPQEEVIGSISVEEATEIANIAAFNEGYDFSRLPLLETKANLVYSEEDSTYEWVVSYFVEYEADPYLLIIIDAFTGVTLSAIRTNYLELYDQWELQRQLPHNFWPIEDLVFFDSLYRKSVYWPRFTLPTEIDISKERAIQLARKALRSKFNISNAFLEQYECSAQLMQDHNQREWFISFCTIVSPIQANVRYQVTMDAQTGEILICRKN